MVSRQGRMDDPYGAWSEPRHNRGGAGAGSLVLATLLGVGIGLLAAPQPGSKTRKLLRKRLESLSQGFGESLGDVQEVSSKARKRAQQRFARLREDAGDEWDNVGQRWQRAKTRIRDLDLGEEEEPSSFGAVLSILAGVAATYFLTSDRAAPVRTRVQDAASQFRRRATDGWDRFQRGGVRQGREGAGQQSSAETQTTTGTNEPPRAS
jgi:hypothetical protein